MGQALVTVVFPIVNVGTSLDNFVASLAIVGTLHVNVDSSFASWHLNVNADSSFAANVDTLNVNGV